MSIGDCVSLHTLNAACNSISHLPVTFASLQHLSLLDLTQNPLVNPPMNVVCSRSHCYSEMHKYHEAHCSRVASKQIVSLV